MLGISHNRCNEKTDGCISCEFCGPQKLIRGVLVEWAGSMFGGNGVHIAQKQGVSVDATVMLQTAK